MKKFIIGAIALASIATAQAQIAEVSAPRQLLRGVQSDMYYPLLSQDGKMLSFTALDNTNLRVYSFDDNVTVAQKATRDQAVRKHFDGHALVFDNPVIRTEGTTLYITRNGREKAVQPVERSAGYLWESLSPDGQKIAFYAAGVGIVVTDLEGRILSMPGNFEAPAWFGNDCLVAQNATDDGHQLHSSQIVLLKADGSAMQPLTKPESMSMFPTASADANRVVYSTVDGLLYELTVTLK